MRTVANLEERLSVPVRVEGDLYRRIARLAASEKRNVKAQIELLLERAMRDEPSLERRGVRRG